MTVEEIRRDLTELYQAKVMQVGAYRTGRLHDSIDVQITMTRQEPLIDVRAVDYHVHVDWKYGITDLWEADPVYTALMEELMYIWVEEYSVFSDLPDEIK